QSKAQRRYGLLDGKSPKAVKMVPVALAPDLSTRAAFQAIAQACLYQLLANQPALRRTNSDALHQSRVALRRLRAAISFFSEMLGDLETEQLKARTRWLTQELAAARELDVFIKQVVKPIATDKPDAPGMVRVATDIRRRRTRAFARAHAAVESTEFRRLVLDITAWINDGQWMRNSDVTLRALGDRPIGETASDELRRRRKKIVKKGERLHELDEQQRHKLRIRIKKLRYSTEFLADAFPGKKAARRRDQFVSRLEKLQNTLGDLNDIAVHEKLTAEVADIHEEDGKGRKARPTKAFAAGRLAGYEQARSASVLESARKGFRAFAKTKPFWA